MTQREPALSRQQDRVGGDKHVLVVAAPAVLVSLLDPHYREVAGKLKKN